MDIAAAIRKFPRQPALVGFSGGADSTALLLALWQEGYPITAIHCHHHLRGEAADADARWCQEFCQQRQIPFRVVDLQVRAEQRPGESLESAARRLRLAQWQSAGQPVFLAHHADDRLEELFLRLARGANATGLTSLRPIRKFADGTTLFRPLLNFRKAELEEFLRSNQVTSWCLDATNADSDCRRNAIRNQLLPLARSIFGQDDGLLAAMDSLAADAQFLECHADACNPRSLRDWQELPPAMLPRVLRRVFALPLPPSRETTLRVAAALQNYTTPIRIPLGDGDYLAVDRSGLRLLQEAAPFPPLTWDRSTTPTLALPNGDRLAINDGALTERFANLPDQLTVRCWQPGDTIRPFGMGNHHRKLQDVFQDKAVPRELRAALPLIATAEEIIWVPGVIRSEFGRVAPGADAVTLGFTPATNAATASSTSEDAVDDN